jgi:hypothetical protein
MQRKIRLARDMAQEAFVVIEAPTSEQAEAIFWHDMDPDVPDSPLEGTGFEPSVPL